MDFQPNFQNDQVDHEPELIFTRIGPLRINMKIYGKRNQEIPLYYVDISGSFSDYTDLALYPGADKEKPVLGNCRFNKFQKSQIEIQPHGRSKFKMSSSKEKGYYWSMPWTSISGGQGKEEQMRQFLWKDIEPASSRSGRLELGLYDTQSSDIHAVYTGALPGTRKGGVLKLNDDDYGEEWRTMVILTLSVLIEQARQKRNREGNSYTIGMLAY
ncbi:hypothetical protein N7493_011709 [Penicillium malachiteum]|uniref:Uncharacterized protein n=1 Tax=Penicillium malachiteum TaxID=1324776 RepID=A0AAD6HAA1_9EURO|nr:hypothetical protein N7493_011709 [Penicillium malachiteum]